MAAAPGPLCYRSPRGREQPSRSPPRGEPGEDALPDLSRSIELVQQVQAGDRDACNELFERYRPRLLRIVRVKLGSGLRRRLDEEDIVQDVLLVAAQQLADFGLRSHAGLLQWLARIADNVIRQKREHFEAEKRDAGREVRLRHGSRTRSACAGSSRYGSPCAWRASSSRRSCPRTWRGPRSSGCARRISPPRRASCAGWRSWSSARCAAAATGRSARSASGRELAPESGGQALLQLLLDPVGLARQESGRDQQGERVVARPVGPRRCRRRSRSGGRGLRVERWRNPARMDHSDDRGVPSSSWEPAGFLGLGPASGVGALVRSPPVRAGAGDPVVRQPRSCRDPGRPGSHRACE